MKGPQYMETGILIYMRSHKIDIDFNVQCLLKVAIVNTFFYAFGSNSFLTEDQQLIHFIALNE